MPRNERGQRVKTNKDNKKKKPITKKKKPTKNKSYINQS